MCLIVRKRDVAGLSDAICAVVLHLPILLYNLALFIHLRKTVVLQYPGAGGDPCPNKVCKTTGVCPSRLTGGMHMERVTLRIPKQQIEEVEQMVETGEFPNRSEAIRSAVREMINEQGDTTEQTGRRRKRSWAKV